MLLSEIFEGRDNNLNIIRFAAAVMVIYGHAYPLSCGEYDILCQLTNGQISFGNLAVCIFFFFSGFLIHRSIQRCKDKAWTAFFRARCRRIFPALAVVVLLCIFILGPCLTEYELRDYFTSTQTYRYLLNAVLIPVHELPGVFTHNIYDSIVNGAL